MKRAIVIVCILSLLVPAVAVGADAGQSTTTPSPDEQNNTTTTTTTTTRSTTTTATTTTTTSDDGGSEWSKARVLALIDDHVSRHSRIDIDRLETWYEAHRTEFSEVEQRYVEAWIEWYRSGEKPTDGLHPDLLPDQATSGQNQSYGVQPRSNLTVEDLSNGRRKVSDQVTVLAWEFDEQNSTWVGIVKVRGDSEDVSYIDFGSMASTGRYTASEATLPRGKHVVKLPAGSFEGTRLVTLADGQTGAVFKETEPPFLRYLKGYYLWLTLGAGVLGSALFSIKWYLRREKILQEFHPAAALISGNVRRSRLLNRFTDENDEDSPADQYDDGVRGLLQRYASIRAIVSTALKTTVLLYVADLIGLIALPLPPIGDEAKLVIGGTAVVYLVAAPALLRPILEAAYDPTLEAVVRLDAQGRRIATYWAKKGVFAQDYEYDRHPPTRETATGERAYLVSDIDRDDKRAEAAFEWQAEEVENIEGLEREQVEYISGQQIGIDQILSDPKRAAIVIEDMLKEARNGKQLRKAFPFVRSKIALEEAKDVAIGINRAITGSSVEPILEDMIDSYESKEDQLEDKFQRETELDGDLDEYEAELDPAQDTDDVGDQPGDADER